METLRYLAVLTVTLGIAACSNSAQIGAAGAGPDGKLVPAAATAPPANDPSNTVIMELKTGKVTIRLRPDLAPKHVERIKLLVSEHFYDGLKFHRVIPGFMAQTGDPKGTGEGGSKHPDLPAEFTATPFIRGTVGAARTSDPNSANSQFFICYGYATQLNGSYTVWGEVTDGMLLVDKIAPGEPPPKPDVIVKMYLASAPR
jgi:peptidylprolyl isomerase